MTKTVTRYRKGGIWAFSEDVSADGQWVLYEDIKHLLTADMTNERVDRESLEREERARLFQALREENFRKDVEIRRLRSALQQIRPCVEDYIGMLEYLRKPYAGDPFLKASFEQFEPVALAWLKERP